jgi:hypothetical protein
MQAEGSFFNKMMRGVEISSCLHCILYFPHGRLLMFAILMPITFLMLAGKGISEERLQNGMIAGSAKGERQIVAWFAADDVLARSARESSEGIITYLNGPGFLSRDLEYIVVVVHPKAVVDGKINSKYAPFANKKQVAAMDKLIEVDGRCGHLAATLSSNQDVIFAFVFSGADSDSEIERVDVDQCVLRALNFANQGN